MDREETEWVGEETKWVREEKAEEKGRGRRRKERHTHIHTPKGFSEAVVVEEGRGVEGG